jgi:hypothetical protein
MKENRAQGKKYKKKERKKKKVTHVLCIIIFFITPSFNQARHCDDDRYVPRSKQSVPFRKKFSGREFFFPG